MSSASLVNSEPVSSLVMVVSTVSSQSVQVSSSSDGVTSSVVSDGNSSSSSVSSQSSDELNLSGLEESSSGHSVRS